VSVDDGLSDYLLVMYLFIVIQYAVVGEEGIVSACKLVRANFGMYVSMDNICVYACNLHACMHACIYVWMYIYM